MTLPPRPLGATLAATVLVTAALAALLAWPGTAIRPMRTKTIELDEPPSMPAGESAPR